MWWWVPDRPPKSQILAFFGKILQKIRCKTFHKKTYFTQFYQFDYNLLSEIAHLLDQIFVNFDPKPYVIETTKTLMNVRFQMIWNHIWFRKSTWMLWSNNLQISSLVYKHAPLKQALRVNETPFINQKSVGKFIQAVGHE